MNETFADLNVVNHIKTNKEVMPFINSLKENTIKGHMLVSVFGGGTSNSEYEFLTGNSMAFLPKGTVAFHRAPPSFHRIASGGGSNPHTEACQPSPQ